MENSFQNGAFAAVMARLILDDLSKIMLCGRRGGQMVSVLDSRSSNPGASFSRGTALCS